MLFSKMEVTDLAFVEQYPRQELLINKDSELSEEISTGLSAAVHHSTLLPPLEGALSSDTCWDNIRGFRGNELINCFTNKADNLSLIAFTLHAWSLSFTSHSFTVKN